MGALTLREKVGLGRRRVGGESGGPKELQRCRGEEGGGEGANDSWACVSSILLCVRFEADRGKREPFVIWSCDVVLSVSGVSRCSCYAIPSGTKLLSKENIDTFCTCALPVILSYRASGAGWWDERRGEIPFLICGRYSWWYLSTFVRLCN